MHRDPSKLPSDHLGLANVTSRTDIDPERLHRIRYRAGALDGVNLVIEGNEETIAGVVDLPAAVPLDRGSDDAVVSLEEDPPPPIPELGREFGRPYDVREEDRGEDVSSLLLGHIRSLSLNGWARKRRGSGCVGISTMSARICR
jgi:hypothetical protein